ncbi:MAG: 30S ribosomal protein S3 [Candidatus Nanohaloarchaeota archaeon]|nr:30S ribosomal protein S3 [Candidatus Nanohaloarchaeota archaeon]
MIERKFVEQAMTNLRVKEYLREELKKAQISHVDIHRTPLNTHVIVYCAKPGFIIGRGGRKIEMLTEKLEKEFGLFKPYIDVKMVENPWIDAAIVARRIGEELERGKKYRPVAHRFLRKIMEAGAYGAEIRISGKLGGERARSEVFRIGYLKKCGEPANENVDHAKDYIVLKPGKIGIKVSIMVSLPEVSLLEKNIADLKVEESKEEHPDAVEKASAKSEEKEKEELQMKEKEEKNREEEKKRSMVAKSKRKASSKGGKSPRRGGKSPASKKGGKKPSVRKEKSSK